jgi:regulation of enolase protein 1 (concanavalin A-like superfamily)
VSSPRLMRPVSGIFAAQTVCRPALEDRPSIGGIVLWKDRKNFLAITKGARGRNEITFCGCLKAKDLIVGRGRLSAETLYLRLERKNGLVRALCSTDGASWWTVGQVEFSASDPVEIGLFAVGKIERYLYPGAFPEGSAIRFDEFRLYQ